MAEQFRQRLSLGIIGFSKEPEPYFGLKKATH